MSVSSASCEGTQEVDVALLKTLPEAMALRGRILAVRPLGWPTAILALLFVFALLLPLTALAQHHLKKTTAATPAVPAPVAAPVAPPNMLDQPAAPATVTERNNTLTVMAENSSLTQILHQVSSATGMQLDGLGGDERVFGSFGPAAPREVLTSLLNGTAYNVMMVGDLPNGAPRQLLLTRKTGSLPKGPAAGAAPPASTGDDDSSDDTGAADDPENAPPPAPPPMATQPRGQPGLPGARTPQDIQDQLQRMRNLQGAGTAPPQ